MPVCTEDSDKAISRSHRNIRWCGGNKCGTKREPCKLYSKEKHTGGLADRLDGKSLLFHGYYLAYGVGHMESVVNARHLPRAIMLLVPMNFFSSR